MASSVPKPTVSPSKARKALRKSPSSPMVRRRPPKES